MTRLLVRILGLYRTLKMLSKLYVVKEVRTAKDRASFTKIWHKVWLEQKYAQPDEPIVGKYSKYDSFSVDVVAKFVGLIPTGTLRLIRYNEEVGLPVLVDFEVTPIWHSTRLFEITLLTVGRRFRSPVTHIAFLNLARWAYQYARQQRTEGLLIAADDRLFRRLTGPLSMPFRQIGPEKFYEGSITYPAYLDIEHAEGHVRAANPTIYRFFTSGLALAKDG